jgi:hypothetical protein
MSAHFERGSPGAAQEIHWDGGCSWIAHPEEDGQRASHAIETDDGVWLFDPIDATNLEDLLEPLGDVCGVAVGSAWHCRDAGRIARRHDVPVHVPAWMHRVERLVDSPVERYTIAPDPEFRMLPCRPFPLWEEALLYHQPSDTLVIPDSLGTAGHYLVGDERLGATAFRRPQPPMQLRGLEPERILPGHGRPVTDDPAEALETALVRARLRFPEAILENGRKSVGVAIAAIRACRR